MSSRVKISVIIPVYNVAAYLPACLESVAGQTFADLEIIAVNDGSTDDSAAVLAQWAEKCPSLRVLTQPNQGVAAARQHALRQACGGTVCFVDGDDFLDKHYLEELWRAYQQTGAKAVIARQVRWPKQNEEPPAGFFRAGCLYGAERVRVFEDFSAAMALCGKLIARECLADIAFPSARTGDDILPSVAVLAACNPVAVAPRAIYFYRTRANSQSRTGAGRFEGLLNGFLQAKKLLQQQGIYRDFAPGFEYVCRVCLTSFMEKYGLTPPEEKALRAARTELQVPGALFKKRPWKFRFRQRIVDFCLRVGFSYAKCWRLLRCFYGSGAWR